MHITHIDYIGILKIFNDFLHINSTYYYCERLASHTHISHKSVNCLYQHFFSYIFEISISIRNDINFKESWDRDWGGSERNKGNI